MELIMKYMGILRNIGLRTKLLLGFSVLILIAAVAGGAGLFFVERIQGKIELVSDVAFPMVAETSTLLNDMEKARTATLSMLSLEDQKKLQEQTGSLKDLEGNLNKELDKFSKLIKEQKIKLDIQAVAKRQEDFFKKAHEAVKLYQTELEKNSAARQKLGDFEKKREEFDRFLNDFAHLSEAAMNEKEEVAKTKEQSGNATVRELQGLLSRLFNEDYPLVKGASLLQRYLIDLQNTARLYIAERDMEKLPAIQKEFEKTGRKIESRLRRVGNRAKTEKQKEIVQGMSEGLTKLKESVLSEGGLFAVHREYVKASLEVEDMKRALASVTAQYKSELDTIYKFSSNLSEDAQKTAKTVVNKSRGGIGVIIIIGITIGILLGIVLARLIVKSIKDITDMIKDIAQGEGDLTKRLKVASKDEIGELARWFNTFVEKLNAIIRKVAESTYQLTSTTEEVSRTTNIISDGAKKQTSQTEQIATSVEEMTATVLDIAKNANEAADSAKKAAEKANKGGDIVKNSVEGMNRIADAVKKSAGTIEALKNSSEQIGEIISVIDDIADQTNLLALNAAIEAARAGEQGRGFAVVADEVRKLAERTTKATKEIADMIKTIQADTGGAVSSMEAGSKEVESGVALTNEAGEALKQIVAEVEKVTDMVQQIATSTEEQSAASEEISSNVDTVATVTKETSTGIIECDRAVQELSQLAAAQNEIVGQFKLDKEKVAEEEEKEKE